ncbi:MAG: hypothetical protein CTY19_05970 [Methylomonas sp.]|nr:MAG: hypothetical protein CTY19_05970 [Methylomonas sp.]
MNLELKLTDTQLQVLTHAIQHTQGRIDWFPEHIKGGARQKVIEALYNKALIDKSGDDCYCVIADVRLALGGQPDTSEPESMTDVTPPSSKSSKQAQVLAMLSRPEGATVPQICATTGWQAHTVRGTFAGAFKKKLGLEITSEKTKGSDRVYRLPAVSAS